jgi:predicted O-methyltransferase YrrM
MTQTNGDFKATRCGNPIVEEVYRTRAIPLADGGTTPMNVYIPREEGDYLYSLVRHLRPSLTVEIGMANGLSTLFVAHALRENGAGRHVAIDPFQSTDWRGAGMALLRKAGLADLVELREQFSHQALPELERQGVRAGFIFIDGAHLFDYVMADFLVSDRLLETNGMIAFDDSDWPAVRQVIRYVLANRKYEVAFPEVVIEPPRIRPTLFGRVVRRTGHLVPKLGEKLRPDFMVPGDVIGVRGRCVVLKKLGDDDRDSQNRACHNAF